MKNVLLLGNGFDLYYNLPTKYINFLRVVNFLLNNRATNYKTVGEVFSQKELQETDSFIEKCYVAHKKTFDDTLLDADEVSKIINLAEKNVWFSYLNKVFNEDVGWIDFEKEIAFVLKCFEKALNQSTYVYFRDEDKDVKYVIDLFEFYIDKIESKKVVAVGTYKVNAEYCIESPVGSGKRVVNKQKVVEKLYKELLALTDALRLYLKCFVENSLESLKINGAYSRIEFLSYMNRTITFNYTNTYERLYFNNPSFHIHGNVSDKLVLGVNPDESDLVTSIDTTFVQFKKYFQRTLYETDYQYLRWLRELMCEGTEYRVFVIGHSLDDTDKDIIEELFKKAKEITVFYHNLDAHMSYITNLIKIFGKEGFDRLKEDKNLAFVSLDGNFYGLKEKLSQESWQDLYATMNINEDNEITIV